MCTVSWLFHDGGYELFCNRDETRARALARAPRPAEENGVAYLAPTDGDAGGTWIAVNEAGLGLCLLNRYPDPTEGEFRSRGLLVRELAGCLTAAEVQSRLTRLASVGEPCYRPFTLLVLEADALPLLAAWDGRHLLPWPGPVLPPLSSSSYDPQGIGVFRRQLWESTVEAGSRELTAEELVAFHRSHLPERGPLSPCMHRHDARTVSFTRVRVSPSAVRMAYADGPPCQVEPARPLTLIRQPSSSPALRQVAPVV